MLAIRQRSRLACIACALLLTRCTQHTMEFQLGEAVFEASVEDTPQDPGTLEDVVDIASIEPSYTSFASADTKRLAMMGWSDEVVEELERYQGKVDRVDAVSLLTSIRNLHQAHLDNRDSHENRVDVVVKAYWDEYTEILETKMEAADAVQNDYEMKLAMADQKSADSLKEILVDGTIAALLGGGGIGLGMGLMDWVLKKSIEKPIEKPDVPARAALIKEASKEAGLGRLPEHGLRAVGGKLYADLLVADSETSKTIHEAYLTLLRRGLNDPEDALRLAESASLCREDAADAMEGAKKIWEKPSNIRRQHVQAIHEDAEDHYDRIGNSLLLTYAIIVIAERTTNYTGMGSDVFLEAARGYYPDLDEDVVDEIDDAVERVEPPDDEWTSVPLRYVLSKVFQEKAVFEAMLGDPGMLARESTVMYERHFELPSL